MPNDTNNGPKSERPRKPPAAEVATPAQQRRAKLAAALRANLQRRKQRSRALRSQDAISGSTAPEDGGGE